MQLCEASVQRRSIISQIWYEFAQYCGAKSNGWLTPKGISEGAEHLYRHNEPRDDWDGKLLAKEYEDHTVYHALFDVYEAHRDCLDWDRFTNHNLLRN